MLSVELPTILAGGVDAGVLSLLKGIPLAGVIVGAAITRATVPAGLDHETLVKVVTEQVCKHLGITAA